jgi:hypothetical protein
LVLGFVIAFNNRRFQRLKSNLCLTKKAGMKKRFAIMALFASSIFVACDQGREAVEPSCDVRATVRDLTGFDGCGFVFELEDGTRLEPLRIGYCGTPPMPKDLPKDPLLGFEFVDGKKVKIGYTLAESGGSICMVGPLVHITCITEERTNDL